MIYRNLKVSDEEALDAFFFISSDTSAQALQGFQNILPKLKENGIDTGNKLALFLANAAHESSWLTRLEENLNYSAKRLRQVWPSRFKTASSARRCANNPTALANAVYNGRMGNRMGTNDGYRFRGRGLYQLTGQKNYQLASKRLGHPYDEDPDLVKKAYHAWLTAMDYFVNRKYKGKPLTYWAERVDHEKVCRAINGGTHGLAERKAMANFLIGLFGADEGYVKKPVVKQGDKGYKVRPIQGMLKTLGYRIYKVDGKYGKGTDKAVRAFQKDNGLVVDGIIGGNTMLRMQKLVETK